MINELELKKLLGDLESDRIERTISTTNTDKVGEAIFAFANDIPVNNCPGYLVIGARDDGAIGAHATAVSKCYMDFKNLTQEIIRRTNANDAS